MIQAEITSTDAHRGQRTPVVSEEDLMSSVANCTVQAWSRGTMAIWLP